MKKLCRLFLSITLVIIQYALPAGATEIILSTTGTSWLGGLKFQKDDLVKYDTVTDTATLFFDRRNFTSAKAEDIDAVYLFPNGDLLLSMANSGYLGGIHFRGGDLVRYHPDTDTAILFFDQDVFTSNSKKSNINAIHVFPDGDLLLSTIWWPSKLGGVTFKNRDLVKYDPVNDAAALFFDFPQLHIDIDAVSLLSNGNIVLSTKQNNAMLGGLAFKDDDLVAYNPVTGETTLLFRGSDHFLNGNADIDAVHIIEHAYSSPEPSTFVLLGIVLLSILCYGWGCRNRRNRAANREVVLCHLSKTV